ncbi:MAG: DUF1444 family protein [Pseudomonadota bacterium]
MLSKLLRRVTTAITALVLAVSSALAAPTMSEAAFTDAYVAKLKGKNPDIEVTVDEPLLLSAKQGEQEQQIMLGNAYELYLNDPDALKDILNRYIDSAVESMSTIDATLTADNVMPVVKDDRWLPEIQALLRERGNDESLDYYFEPLTDGLVVFYVLDTPSNIRYVSRGDLAASGIGFDDLREVAVGNLDSLMEQLEAMAGEGFYALFLDGNYDASLLLVDAIWNSGSFDVAGDLVVAVPARDILLITGSDEDSGLEMLVEFADKSYDESPYRLTRNFYRRSGNSWELFRRR